MVDKVVATVAPIAVGKTSANRVNEPRRSLPPMIPLFLQSISSTTLRGVCLGTVLFWGLVSLTSNATLDLGSVMESATAPRLRRVTVERVPRSFSECTAELLSERTAWIPIQARRGTEESYNGATDNRRDHNGTTWAWEASAKVQEHCLLLGDEQTTAPNQRQHNMISPLESSPTDIQSALQNKWIMMVGDSSVRMLHDYLVGRWLGEYQSWPTGMDNHGPKHTYRCSGSDEEIQKRDGVPFCHFEVFHQGARVTFIWMPLDLNKAIPHILGMTIGTPDFFFVQHGYWETLAYKHKKNPTEQEVANASLATNTFVAAVDQWTREIREMEDEYPKAYKYATDGTDTSAASSRQSPPHRVWLSSFLPDHDAIDGAHTARSLGWDVLNRTNLRDPRTQQPFPNPHVDNEILEVELELLLTLIRSVG